MDHPAWCVKCTAAVGGPHRSAVHTIGPDVDPLLFWWLTQTAGGAPVVVLAAGGEPIAVPVADLGELAQVIGEVAARADA